MSICEAAPQANASDDRLRNEKPRHAAGLSVHRVAGVVSGSAGPAALTGAILLLLLTRLLGGLTALLLLAGLLARLIALLLLARVLAGVLILIHSVSFQR